MRLSKATKANNYQNPSDMNRLLQEVEIVRVVLTLHPRQRPSSSRGHPVYVLQPEWRSFWCCICLASRDSSGRTQQKIRFFDYVSDHRPHMQGSLAHAFAFAFQTAYAAKLLSNYKIHSVSNVSIFKWRKRIPTPPMPQSSELYRFLLSHTSVDGPKLRCNIVFTFRINFNSPAQSPFSSIWAQLMYLM